MEKKNLKKLKIPKSPGVYFFLRGREILYIGKATELNNRVKSYFGKDLIGTRGPLLVDMIFYADKINWQKTDSVLEALILEAGLIKKYQPKYNTKEKDDKSFNYAVITREKLPKVIIVRGNNLKNYPGYVFGPFTSGSQLKEALKIIRRIFPFLDDKSKNYAEFYRQINLVPDLGDTQMYLQNIKNIKLFFQGKKKKILKNLEKEMKIYAKEKQFEKAGEIKRQIFALKHINDVALLKSENLHYSDAQAFVVEAYDVAHMGGKNMVGVMTVVTNGQVQKSEYKKFSARGGSAFGGKTVLGDSKANDTGALGEILERRLAHTEWLYPSLIVVDGGKAQINTAQKVLARLGLKIPVVSVLKDERHRPKNILGDSRFAREREGDILLANSEAHRFAIAYHKNRRAKDFIKR